jgi:putative membrane protein
VGLRLHGLDDEWLGHGLRLVIVALIIAGVVWLVRAQPIGSGPRRSTGLDVLEERYARGEISREEYLQMKRDISN